VEAKEYSKMKSQRPAAIVFFNAIKLARPASGAIAAMALVAACSSASDNEIENTGEATAALLGSAFECTDGDLVVTSSASLDWAKAPNLSKTSDMPSGTSDDACGGGAKEDIENPTIVTGSIPPNKSDLTRFYVSHENVSGQNFLYLAWRRTNILGSANMDFEFNQSNKLGPNGVTTVRTAGDILITFDFVKGGDKPVLGLLKWIESGPATQCFASNALPCWGSRIELSTAGFAEGSVNTGTVTDPLDGDASLPELTFGEAAINLTAAGVLSGNVCRHFGRAQLRSRSSASFTAEIKDIIAPMPVDISNCQPAVVRLKKVDAVTGESLSGAVLKLVDSSGNVIPCDSGTDTCTTAKTDDPATDGVGDCVYTLHDSMKVTASEVRAPNGYLTAPDQILDVKLNATPQTFVLTFKDTPVLGRINVHKSDDLGKALAGAVFSLLRDNAPIGGKPGVEDTQVGLPQTSDASGLCSFPDLEFGAYWVVETQPPPGHFLSTPAFQHVIVSLGAAPGEGQVIDLAYSNGRKFHSIVFVCQSSNNTLYPSTVSLLGAPGQLSLSLSQAQAMGLDGSKLCQIKQGNFGDRAVGDNNGVCTMSIPVSQ
jgi:hypothetical protein